jgi:uncharacterized protein with GYD domain
MPSFILATKLAHGALKSSADLGKLEKDVKRRIRQSCPEVKWLSSFATLGPYDYIDVFSAPDIETATKVATIIRSFGHAHTETWPAIEWKQFKTIARDIAGIMEAP